MAVAVAEQPAWGHEVRVDFRGADPEFLDDAEHIARFAADLVDALGMRAYGPPQTPRFGLADESTAGITLVQLIETSSVTFHFAPNLGEGYGNVFSCRPFDPSVVVALVIERFRPVELFSDRADRGRWSG